jgi:hypothetical protein
VRGLCHVGYVNLRHLERDYSSQTGGGAHFRAISQAESGRWGGLALVRAPVPVRHGARSARGPLLRPRQRHQLAHQSWRLHTRRVSTVLVPAEHVAEARRSRLLCGSDVRSALRSSSVGSAGWCGGVATRDDDGVRAKRRDHRTDRAGQCAALRPVSACPHGASVRRLRICTGQSRHTSAAHNRARSNW